MTNPEPTRRNALVAIGTAGALIAAPVAVAARVEARSAPSSSAWHQAMSRLAKAKAASNEASAHYDRALDAYEAVRPSMDAIHWQAFPYEDRCHVARVMDIEKRWQAFLQGEGKLWHSRNPTRDKARQRRALLSVRDFRRAEQAAKDRCGLDAAEARWEAADDELTAAEEALVMLPAPHGEALLWKLELVMEVSNGSSAGWDEKWVDAIMADARRLLSAGRA